MGHKLFDKASKTEDPVKRAAYCVIALSTGFSSAKIRKKKPFNAMLGETYEYVCEDFRFLGEKVRHIPE